MKAFADPHNTQEHGMDLRDWFAGLAMQAIVSRSDARFSTSLEYVSHRAYEYADEMMRAREANEENTGR
jgi:hypothetical protein